MTKQEFIGRTNIEVSDAEFESVNRMYMTVSDSIDKDEFCKDYKKHHDSVLLKDYARLTVYHLETIKKLEAKYHTAALYILRKAIELQSPSMELQAISMIGRKETVIFKLNNNYELSEHDRKYLIELVNND